jgi:hypothetical protein
MSRLFIVPQETLVRIIQSALQEKQKPSPDTGQLPAELQAKLRPFLRDTAHGNAFLVNADYPTGLALHDSTIPLAAINKFEQLLETELNRANGYKTATEKTQKQILKLTTKKVIASLLENAPADEQNWELTVQKHLREAALAVADLFARTSERLEAQEFSKWERMDVTSALEPIPDLSHPQFAYPEGSFEGEIGDQNRSGITPHVLEHVQRHLSAIDKAIETASTDDLELARIRAINLAKPHSAELNAERRLATRAIRHHIKE